MHAGGREVRQRRFCCGSDEMFEILDIERHSDLSLSLILCVFSQDMLFWVPVHVAHVDSCSSTYKWKEVSGASGLART
jgi:hypothetical protein